MKIMLHTCCGPCSIYPVEELRHNGHTVIGFFYRHNIHPYTECMKREETLLSYADDIQMKVITQQDYQLESFLQRAVFREADRCRICYYERLYETALMAKRGKCDGYTSTLLYSKRQNHEMITEIGQAVGKKVGVPFIYEDYRTGWKHGIEKSKSLRMYRQSYCGCIYSEKDRYYKKEQTK